MEDNEEWNISNDIESVGSLNGYILFYQMDAGTYWSDQQNQEKSQIESGTTPKKVHIIVMQFIKPILL